MSTVEMSVSRFTRRLDRGFYLLRFSPELEDGFRSSYRHENAERVRFAVLVGVVLLAAAGLVDAFTLPSRELIPVAIIRYLLVCPLILILYWAARRSSRRALPDGVVLAAALVAGAGLVAMSGLSGAAVGDGGAVGGVVLFTLYVYFLLGLRFWNAVACSLAVLVLYFLAAVAGQVAGPALARNLLLLVAVNGIAAMGCYLIEYQARKRFVSDRALGNVAQHDALTGLYTKSAFLSQFNLVWGQARRCGLDIAVLAIDVDCFREYNEAHGHAEGDACLQAVAGVLAESVRRPLDLLGRYEGEEFVCVCFDTGREAAEQIAEDMRLAVMDLGIPHRASDVADSVTISVGIESGVPGDDTTPADFLMAAEAALYNAKRSGRNACFTDRLEEAPLARLDEMAD